MIGLFERSFAPTLVALAAAVLSCSEVHEGEGGECRPGEEVECVCEDGGVGTEVCDEDGAGWGECECDGDSGADDGSLALVRFCHSLTYGGDATDLHLKLGEGESSVVLTAGTWACSPLEGEDCAEIPVGADVSVSLSSDSAGELFASTYTLEDGEAYFFEACEDQGDVYLTQAQYADAEDCHEATYGS
jgi:hypothetical protein